MRKRLYAFFALLAAIAAVAAHYRFDPWGFYHKTSREEAAVRLSLVETAGGYLGCSEADGSYMQILDRYNAQQPLPQGYALMESDSWCAAFVTVCALEAGLAEHFPEECSCQRQISLWQEMGRWIENDRYIPAPGDLIYYNWDEEKPGDNTGWSDHVGIVVGTKWPFIKVIEGNYDDRVQYRVVLLGDLRIRGFGQLTADS